MSNVTDERVEAACAAYLSAEFNMMGEAWFHPSERGNFIHEGTKRIAPQMRAALDAADRQPISDDRLQAICRRFIMGEGNVAASYETELFLRGITEPLMKRMRAALMIRDVDE
jgi:hypothetical protein